MSLFDELRRRNVFRVAAAYLLVAWLLLQVVDVITPILALPDWFGRVVLVFLSIAFPVALLFAWAFELTPEGVKLEKNVDRDKSITRQTGRNLDRIIIGVLVVALALSVTANLRGTDNSSEPQPSPAVVAKRELSIAVLPFVNRSMNESDAFFVDGMHDDLLTQLAKISALKVISRTSVLQYRDTEKSMKVIGEELDVATLLEGGVQRAGDRIRINVQLIDAQTDEHLWAETYNRELTTDNIFEIQENIAKRIAEALHAALSPAEERRIAGRPTDNLQAYEAYLVGRQKLLNRRGPEIRESTRFLKEAIAADPTFAEAYASLAEAYMVQYNYSQISREELMERVPPLVDAAQRLNPDLGVLYNVMAGLAEYDGEIERAEAYYRKAIELNPGFVTAYHWLGLFHLNYSGRFQEAVLLYDKALSLDPLWVYLRANQSGAQSALGRFDEARENLRAALRLDPNHEFLYRTAGVLLQMQDGRSADALMWIQRSAQMDPEFVPDVALAFWIAGDMRRATLWQEHSVELLPSSALTVLVGALLREGEDKRGEAVALAERLRDYARDIIPDDVGLRILRDHLLDAGDVDAALAMYEAAYPRLLDADPAVNLANVLPAVNLIAVLQQAGQNAQAEALAADGLSLLQSVPRMSAWNPPYLKDVEIHALLGNRDAAIAALADAVADGLSLGNEWGLSHRNLASIADDPEFRRLMGVIEGRAAAERAKIDELVEAGKLADTPDQLSSIEFDLSL